MFKACLLLFLLLFTAGFPTYARKQMFAAANASCVRCGRRWDDGWMLECHHKKPLSLGGANSLDNGELICRSCHLSAHEKLFNEAKRKNDTKAENVNAHSIRLIKGRIKSKGHKRYGF